MHEVVSCRALDGYWLEVGFADGAVGRVDVEALLWGPVFEPLRDRAFFAQVRVDPVLATVFWPNGADLSPEFLRDAIRQQPVAR